VHVITVRNVRDALLQSVRYLTDYGNKEQTRIGQALVAPQPVSIHYLYPKEHVLVNPDRDANPFFHLMEAMWMLAGRDDAAFLDHYISYFSKMFAKDGIVMDAYGQRWRHGLKYNQLDEIVNQLRKEPNSRQAVLQMWGAGRDDLRAYSSKPCNLVVTFRIQVRGTPIGEVDCLDMAVINRSNDLIWGCCGANAVHFPILQEYMAARIGVELGEYWQISTNLHLYEHHYEMAKKIEPVPASSAYEPTVPLVKYAKTFDQELLGVMDFIDQMHKGFNPRVNADISNPFLSRTVVRMAIAHYLHKRGSKFDAMDIVETVEAEDWRRAGKEWLERRYVNRE